MAGTYTLYGWKQTGSCAIEAALAEAGATFNLVPVSTKSRAHLTPDFARINPRQQLPALTLPDGTHMAEGSAILLHLADAFPDRKLAPPPGSSNRAQHDRWLMFFAVNVYEGELRKLFPARYTVDASGAAGVATAAKRYVEHHYMLFEASLGDGPYLFGARFTIVDIYVWMLAQWMPQGWLSARCPKIACLAQAVASRPAIAPVHAFHFADGV